MSVRLALLTWPHLYITTITIIKFGQHCQLLHLIWRTIVSFKLYSISFATVIECGFPASIGNGHYLLNNNSRSYQSSLTYHCKDGYVLVGRAHLVCDADARWNGPPPRCEPVLCPSPPMIVNGFYTLSGNSTMFGSLVEYNCDPGYQLIGERTIICNMAGYWEGQPGYCDRKWH